MPPRRTSAPPSTADYRHDETRLNNPPAGLADVNPLPPARRRYEYDPRLDPQLVWAGKAEHLTFDVETVPRTPTSASPRAAPLPLSPGL